jgi:hypothetical protein
MPDDSETVAHRVALAAARTEAAGTARLFAAWCTGSPVPEAADRRCEGVANLGTRRASVRQSVFFTEGLTQKIIDERDDPAGFPEGIRRPEMIYDGANAYIRVQDAWTVFGRTDPGGPRHPNDPLWPLDALFGANDDAVPVGTEAVRGEPVTRCRLTVDLARADAELPAGVSVPGGPYRWLSRLPAEVWLDGAGRARRIAVNSEPTEAAAAEVWSIVELWDFGVAADITPPAPDEVVTPAQAYRLAEHDSPDADARRE